MIDQPTWWNTFLPLLDSAPRTGMLPPWPHNSVFLCWLLKRQIIIYAHNDINHIMCMLFCIRKYIPEYIIITNIKLPMLAYGNKVYSTGQLQSTFIDV